MMGTVFSFSVFWFIRSAGTNATEVACTPLDQALAVWASRCLPLQRDAFVYVGKGDVAIDAGEVTNGVHADELPQVPAAVRLAQEHFHTRLGLRDEDVLLQRLDCPVLRELEAPVVSLG